MKPGDIAELVDRGIELRDRIKTDTAELKKVEEKLKAAGYEAAKEGDHQDLKDANREGTRWLARGSQKVLPVIFTADSILGSFTRNTDLHRSIEAAAGNHFNVFFKPVSKFENRFDDGVKFRARAHELFGKTAPEFITACLSRDKHGIAKSSVQIAWDDVEPATPAK
jgi:hypothetical protein